MGNKIEYIRCPRCELNYIDKREKMCKVCQNELQAKGNKELTDEEIKELNLCPVCKTNYLIDDEEICSECLAEKEILENNEMNLSDDQMDDKDERSENWRAYVENDDAETPEEEFGDMSSITTEDDVIDESDLDLGMDGDEDFDDEFDDEFEDEDDFDESFDDLGYDEDDLDEDDIDDEYDDDDFDDEDK